MKKYRIVQKVGHGGYWIQKRFLFFWLDYTDHRHAPGNQWYAQKEWAESEIKDLMAKPQAKIIETY